MRERRRFPWTIGLVVVLAAFYTACGGGGGSRTTGPTAGSGSPGLGQDPPRNEGGGSGGDGGDSGSSLSTVRFRTLDVAVSPRDGGTVSDNFDARGSAVQDCTACRERYRQGTEVTLTATAAPGFVFARWEGSACDGSPSPTCSLTIERDAQVTAVFR